MPPYFRVVELSAWVNSWKSLATCSFVMPMPVSDTRRSSQSAPSALVRARVSDTVPLSVNLQALLRRLRTIWRTRVTSLCILPISAGQSSLQPVAVARRQRLRRAQGVVDENAEIDVLVMELELAGLDLRKIEDIVDELQQMLAGAADASKRLENIRLAGILGILDQHLGDADDGVQGRPQLVAHRREEAALGEGRLHRLVTRDGEPIDELAQLQLALFRLGDIGEDANDAAVRGPPLADPQPFPAGALLLDGARGMMVPLQARGDPRLALAGSVGNVVAPDQRGQDGLVLDAGRDRDIEVRNRPRDSGCC